MTAPRGPIPVRQPVPQIHPTIKVAFRTVVLLILAVIGVALVRALLWLVTL